MILDQLTYDRLNEIEKGIEALWKMTDDIFGLYARVNTIEATIARLVEEVGLLGRTAFPERETPQIDARKDKTNETSKKKPKAKKKTIRKTP